MSIPDDKISDKPGPQLSVGFPAAQRLRGMARDASPGFLGRQAKLDAGHVHRQVQAGKRAGTGVIVGGDRHWHAVFSELFNRWTLALLQKIERAGQQNRNRAALRHRLNACVVNIFDMIG